MDMKMRRYHEKRSKARVRKILARDGFDITPEIVGLWASTHGKPCSCILCGNPRRYCGERTRQEKIMELNFKDMINNGDR